jgi:predicted HicB family RNase H-like nuclease
MAQDIETYSTNVRFPGEMKEDMQRVAAAEFRSLNGLIIVAVTRYLEEHDRTAAYKKRRQEA